MECSPLSRFSSVNVKVFFLSLTRFVGSVVGGLLSKIHRSDSPLSNREPVNADVRVNIKRIVPLFARIASSFLGDKSSIFHLFSISSAVFLVLSVVVLIEDCGGLLCVVGV